MKRFEDFPKNLKKTLRYIKQEASLEQLISMEPLLIGLIHKRKEELSNCLKKNGWGS